MVRMEVQYTSCFESKGTKTNAVLDAWYVEALSEDLNQYN
jgi:hypothetical protein